MEAWIWDNFKTCDADQNIWKEITMGRVIQEEN